MSTSLVFASRERKKGNRCRIIYLSRTHNQLEQVIQELRKLPFNVKSAVFGSKIQLCPRNEIRSGGSKKCSKKCFESIKSQTCSYYTNFKKNKFVLEKKYKFKPLNITEIKNEMIKNEICPFYFTKIFESEADIIFMPYFFLLNWKIRKIKNQFLENSIVIFDEAHNFIEQSEEGQNIEISSEDLISVFEEIESFYEPIKSKINSKEQIFFKFISFFIDACLSYFNSNELLSQFNNSEEYGDPHNFLNFFEKAIYQKINYHSKQYERNFIDQIIGKIKHPCSLLKDGVLNIEGVIKGFKNVRICLMKYYDQESEKQNQNQDPNLNIVSTPKPNMFFEILNLEDIFIRINDIFKPENYVISQYNYRSDFEKYHQISKSQIIRLVSLTPEETFKDILNCKINSLVLTSGTLKPFQMFEKELKTKFPIKFDGNHVIKFANQVIFNIR